jgi:hypothetical protein
MKEKLKTRPEEAIDFGFYCNIRDAREIQLLRQASTLLGWPSNRSLLHLLATDFLKNNGDLML